MLRAREEDLQNEQIEKQEEKEEGKVYESRGRM